MSRPSPSLAVVGAVPLHGLSFCEKLNTPGHERALQKTLRLFPAMAAGLPDHVWSPEKIVLLANRSGCSVRTFLKNYPHPGQMVEECGGCPRQLSFADLKPGAGAQVVVRGFLEHRAMPGKGVPLNGFCDIPTKRCLKWKQMSFGTSMNRRDFQPETLPV
jgi:hypothetical protein